MAVFYVIVNKSYSSLQYLDDATAWTIGTIEEVVRKLN